MVVPAKVAAPAHMAAFGGGGMGRGLVPTGGLAPYVVKLAILLCVCAAIESMDGAAISGVALAELLATGGSWNTLHGATGLGAGAFFGLTGLWEPLEAAGCLSSLAMASLSLGIHSSSTMVAWELASVADPSLPSGSVTSSSVAVAWPLVPGVASVSSYSVAALASVDMALQWCQRLW